MADDFVVPGGEVWMLESVVVVGILFKASLPLSIRADAGGHPGAPLANADLVMVPTATSQETCCASAKDYLFELPTSLTLPAGTYWLAVEGSDGFPSSFAWQISGGIGSNPQATSDGGATWAVGGSSGGSFVLFGTSINVQQSQTITFSAITPNPALVGGSATLASTTSSQLAVSYTSLTSGRVHGEWQHGVVHRDGHVHGRGGPGR